MSQFPLSEVSHGLGVLSDAPAHVMPPDAQNAPKVAAPTEPPPVEVVSDGLSCVQRDIRDSIELHEGLVGKAIEALRTIYDPEIPVNIYDLGLIYQVSEYDNGKLYVRMTLTSPMCPVAGSLPPDVKNKMQNQAGATEARVDVVWEPTWSPERMSEAARLQLNMF